MATKIVTKNSSTASAVPTASDLVQGELAVNVADKKLFTEDNSGAIIELADGVKLAGIEASADVTDTANVTAAGALMDSELTSEASVKALNQGVATTDSPAFAGLTVEQNVGSKLTFSSTDTGIATNEVIGEIDFFSNDASGIGAASRGSISLVAQDAAGAGSMLFKTSNASSASAERMRIGSSGNVGIGTSLPSSKLSIHGSAGDAYLSQTNTSNSQRLEIGNAYSLITGGSGSVSAIASDNTLAFATSDTERMRIDDSGNIGLRSTSNVVSSTSGSGAWVSNGNYVAIAREGTSTSHPPLYVNQTGIDGQIITLRKDGSTVAALGNYATSYLLLGGYSGSDAFLIMGSSAVAPATSTGAARDNAIDLGTGSRRFEDIYATNSTIQTSDRNEKQDIAELSDAEQRVAVAAKGLLRKFRWRDSVAEKGDEARIHFGIIAQDLQAAFVAEGLDAGRYGMFISTTWWEQDVEVPAVEAAEAVYETQTDDEGNETQLLIDEAIEAVDAYTETHTYPTIEEAPEGAIEKTRLGVRYSELLAFIISAL